MASTSINSGEEEEKLPLISEENGSPKVEANTDLEKQLTVLEELRDIFRLTVPLFFSSLSWVAMKTTDTALLGHSGTKYLEASALSDLWTSR